MRFSLPSRDAIADSIETVVEGMSYDALVTVGCDKNLPGALMAMLRVNRSSILVYGGTIASGCHNGEKQMWYQYSKHGVRRILVKLWKKNIIIL